MSTSWGYMWQCPLCWNTTSCQRGSWPCTALRNTSALWHNIGAVKVLVWKTVFHTFLNGSFLVCTLSSYTVHSEKWAWHKLWGGAPQEQDLVRRKRREGRMIYIYQKSYWEQDAMAAYGKQNLRTKRSFRRSSQTCARNIHEYNSSWLLNRWRAQLNIMSIKSFSQVCLLSHLKKKLLMCDSGVDTEFLEEHLINESSWNPRQHTSLII